MKIERNKDWWMKRAEEEGDRPVGAGLGCESWCREDGAKLCINVHPGQQCYPAMGHYCSPRCSANASATRKEAR